jgi:hypothetical protein
LSISIQFSALRGAYNILCGALPKYLPSLVQISQFVPHLVRLDQRAQQLHDFSR